MGKGAPEPIEYAKATDVERDLAIGHGATCSIVAVGEHVQLQKVLHCPSSRTTMAGGVKLVDDALKKRRGLRVATLCKGRRKRLTLSDRFVTCFAATRAIMHLLIFACGSSGILMMSLTASGS